MDFPSAGPGPSAGAGGGGEASLRREEGCVLRRHGRDDPHRRRRRHVRRMGRGTAFLAEQAAQEVSQAAAALRARLFAFRELLRCDTRGQKGVHGLRLRRAAGGPHGARERRPAGWVQEAPLGRESCHQ